MQRSTTITREALARVDFLVVLPLTASDGMIPGADEHLLLRDAMNDVLLDLVGNSDIVGERVEVVEITGDQKHRLAALEALAINPTG